MSPIFRKWIHLLDYRDFHHWIYLYTVLYMYIVQFPADSAFPNTVYWISIHWVDGFHRKAYTERRYIVEGKLLFSYFVFRLHFTSKTSKAQTNYHSWLLYMSKGLTHFLCFARLNDCYLIWLYKACLCVQASLCKMTKHR